MRTETEVENREMLAVWMKEDATHIAESPAAFTGAVRKSEYSRSQEKRDFLALSSTDSFITKNVNNTRQSCTAVFLNKLPQVLVEDLKKSKHYLHYTLNQWIWVCSIQK